MTDAAITPTPEDLGPHCPHCETVVLRRRKRQGTWEKIILSSLHLYPWECRLCRKTLFLRRRFPPFVPGARNSEQGKPPVGVRPHRPFKKPTRRRIS